MVWIPPQIGFGRLLDGWFGGLVREINLTDIFNM
jgi:hypothetical protein